MIKLLIFNCLIIFGIYLNSNKGQMFYFMRWFAERYLMVTHTRIISQETYHLSGPTYETVSKTSRVPIQWLHNPLIDCPACMASIYGTLFYWFVYPMVLESLAWWPVYCLILCGINSIVSRIIDKISL